MNTFNLRTSIPTLYPWCLGTKPTTKNPQKSYLPTGEPLVMYNNKSGRTVVHSDICPHRGAKFSQGKVQGNCIQCPYHGWTYDEFGDIKSVPSSRGHLPQSHVPNFKVNEYENFVWTESCRDIPHMSESSKYYVTGSEIVEGNWIDWIQNATDISHINFVHDFANENMARVDDMKIYEDEYSVTCEALVTPKASSIFTEHMQVPKAPIISKFIYPNTTEIRIKLKEPYEFVTYTTLTPIDLNRTRITWYFGYNMSTFNPLGDKMLADEFARQMVKTIREDEAIIKELDVYNEVIHTNVKCDMFQYKVLVGLNKLYSNNLLTDVAPTSR